MRPRCSGICGAIVFVAVLGGALVALCVAASAQTEERAGPRRQVEELTRAGRYGEAVSLAEQALAQALTEHGEEHLETAARLHALADLLDRGFHRERDALPKAGRALAIREKLRGPGHPETAESLDTLGSILMGLSRDREAEELIRRGLAIREQALGADHPDVAKSLHKLVALGAGAAAEALAKRALAIREKALGSEHPDTAESLVDLGGVAWGQGHTADAEQLFRRALDIREKALGPEHPDTATSIGVLGNLLRSQSRSAAAARPGHQLSIRTAQSYLRPGEALYQVMVGKDESFAWVITKAAVRWRVLPIGEKELADDVAALRCGLDESIWQTGGNAEAAAGRDRCERLLGPEAAHGAALPFDLARAHGLYQKLLAPFESTIRGRNLLLVLSGPLTTLPLHALVTAPPDGRLTGTDRFAKAAWLAKRQPVTVLPSVSGLKALRTAAVRSRATHPFAAFANPLLTGPGGTDRTAWEKQRCPAPKPVGAARAARAATPARDLMDLAPGGIVDLERIRRQPPLP